MFPQAYVLINETYVCLFFIYKISAKKNNILFLISKNYQKDFNILCSKFCTKC